jgi:hypothetical protein
VAERKPRYSHEEFARRGKEIYERVVRPTLTPEDDGKFVAIDIETSEYEIDSDDYEVVERLYRRLPDAPPWIERVGWPAAYSIGWFPRKDQA